MARCSTLSYMTCVFPKYDCLSFDGRKHLYDSFTNIGIYYRSGMASLTDMTDARQLAKQQLWAATTPAAANQAFNVTNGDVFRWKWMCSRIAKYFDLPAADYPASLSPLERQMADDQAVWTQIVAENGLKEPDIGRLISPWHTDADLGRPIEVVTDMSKSRAMGFTAYQASDQAFFDLFDKLREMRLIP